MVNTDIDIDRWSHGRDLNGNLSVKYMKASYPFIKCDNVPEWQKIIALLKDLIEDDHTGLRPYITFPAYYIFFLSKEDADLAKGLRYIC